MKATLLTTLIVMTFVPLLSCTETGLQRVPPVPAPPLDNLIRVTGEFCTEPSAQITFPVKVLYIIDQSASLQCTDSQNRRFGALNSSINNLLSSQPNAQFGFIGFSSWAREQDFTRDRDAISQFVDPSGGLGPATDYQGALANAVRVIERDILTVGGPERARTRYIINLSRTEIPSLAAMRAVRTRSRIVRMETTTTETAASTPLTQIAPTSPTTASTPTISMVCATPTLRSPRTFTSTSRDAAQSIISPCRSCSEFKNSWSSKRPIRLAI